MVSKIANFLVKLIFLPLFIVYKIFMKTQTLSIFGLVVFGAE